MPKSPADYSAVCFFPRLVKQCSTTIIRLQMSSKRRQQPQTAGDPRIDKAELPSVVVRKLQKLIALYKQSKNNPKITGWGDGWLIR